jgi:uncharacterized membrane protein (Fun14 family)
MWSRQLLTQTSRVFSSALAGGGALIFAGTTNTVLAAPMPSSTDDSNGGDKPSKKDDIIAALASNTLNDMAESAKSKLAEWLPPSGTFDKVNSSGNSSNSISDADWKPVAEGATLGSITGFCAGYALKKVGRTAAVVAGVGFIAVSYASYKGVVGDARRGSALLCRVRTTQNTTNTQRTPNGVFTYIAN